MVDIEKSLAYKFPELAKEWHSSKNGDLTPFDVTSGSKKKVWWICERGHLWDAQIYNRTAKKTGCPYCSGRQPIVGETDLASKFPELVKEWDFEKNSNLSPSEVTGTSTKKVWWKGKCGHSWSAQISNRTSQKSGCPICSNQMVLEGYNDLMSQKPEVIHEWDFDKNDALGIKPNEVFVNTGKAAWWICNECGHNWQAPIKIRVAGSSCPECAKKTRIKSQREQLKKSKVSFAVTNSLLLEEWDYEKNNKLNPEDYSAGSAKKVWWVCQKGHSWEAAIKTRCAGIGCPECAQEKHISFPEKAIAYYLKVAGIEINENYRPDFLNGLELDIYIPSMRCAIEYDGQRWHKNIEKDLRKDLLCKEHEIRLIRLREPKCPKIESESIVLDSLTYKSLTTAIQTLFELLNLKSDIDVVRDEVQIHELILYLEREHSFAVQFPKIAEEWHPIKNGKLKPNNVTPFSGKMVWWKGFCGHEWKMKVANRSLGQKCPICQNKRVVIGMNDLATSNPEIIEEWDCEKNKSLSPKKVSAGSHNIVWWKCKKCGNEWKAEIRARVTGGGKCPNCSNEKKEFDYQSEQRSIIKSAENGNSIQVKVPELAKEWHPTKNGVYTPQNVAPNSNKKFWWKCPEGHEYVASPLDRKFGSGCPYCSGRRHNRFKCLENGKIYEKYSDAEKELGIPRGLISRMFKRAGQSTHGYHFYYEDE